MKRILSVLIALTMALCVSACGGGVPQEQANPGGNSQGVENPPGISDVSTEADGSEEHPYLIQTAEDLAAIRDDLSASYRLEADIDLAGIEWTPIGAFVPVGTEDDEEQETPKQEDAFIGHFDGAGHTISNLTIHLPDEIAVGLFGCTSYAMVNNLTVENATVDGNLMAGAVIGYSHCSTVSGVSLTGRNTITGHIGENGNAGMIGGVIGAGIDSMLDSCSSEANIILPDNASNAGILGGGLEVTSVVNGYATGTLTAGNNCYGLGGVSGCGFGSEEFTNCTAENVTITTGDNTCLIGGVTGYAGGYENEEYGVTVTAITGCNVKNVALFLGKDYSAVGGIIGGGFYLEEYAPYGAPYDAPTVFTLLDCSSNATVNGENIKTQGNQET